MSAAAAGDDGYDTEEEFAKELAALGSSSESDDEDLIKPQPADTDDDDDTEDCNDALSEDGGEAGGGGALAALKRRLAEQEAKMDDFDAELQTLKGDSDWKAPAPPSPAPSGNAAAALGTLEEGAKDVSGVPGGEAGGEAAFGVQAESSVREADEALDTERFRARREYEASERRRAEEREEARRRAHEEAEEERRRREREAAEEERRMEEAAARRVAELEAQQAAEAARIEEELREHAAALEAEKAEAAAAERRAVEAAEAQRVAEAAREAKKEERAKGIREMQGAVARKAVAALRVWHAWQRYAKSGHREARLAALVRVQALQRGREGRKEAGLLRRRRDASSAMEAARAAGDQAALEEAAAAAEALGLGSEAAKELRALEDASRKAAGALTRAAQVGDAEAFFGALAEAERFSRLGGLLGEAKASFSQRQGAALRRAEEAAAGSEAMPRVQDLIKAAAALGAEEQRLRDAERRASERDARAADALSAAVTAAEFDPAEMRSCLERVELLGLRPDAAAAKQRVAMRQVAAGKALKAAGEEGGADDLAEAAREARTLGLGDAVGPAEAQLAKRRGLSGAALASAASGGSAAEFEAAAAEASRLGLPQQQLKDASEKLETRRREAAEALEAAAEEGSMEAFTAAAMAAISLAAAAPEALARAEGAVCARRKEALGSVIEAARAAVSGSPEGRRVLEMAEGALPQWGSCGQEEVAAAYRRLGSSDSSSSSSAAAASPETEVVLRHSTWESFLASGQCPAPAAAPAAKALELCGALGMGAWAAAGWAAVRAAAAAGHAAGCGSVVVLRTSLNYWGRPKGSWEAEVGPEVKALCDPIAALSGTAEAAASRAPLWPQPSDPSDTEAARRGWEEGRSSWTGAAEPGGDPEASTALEEEPEAAKGPEAKKEGTATEGGALATLSAEMLAANSPGVPLCEVASLDISLEGLGSLGAPGLLAGLCPRVRVLNASVNRLPDALGELRGCTALEELNLRENAASGLRGAQALVALRRLQADANCIRSLQGLEGCSGLQELSLSDNRVSSVSPQHLAACTLLQSLCLASNRLRALRLPPLAALQHLDVSNNRIRSLEGLGACSRLLTLTASSNELAAVPDLGASPLLQELILNENRIEELPAMPWMPHLAVVNLQDNRISSLPALTGLPQLSELNLAFNRLHNANHLVAMLSGATGLRSLQVSDNPAAATEGFRDSLLRRLPWLQDLNHDEIDPEGARRIAAVTLAATPVVPLAVLRARVTSNRPLVPPMAPGAGSRPSAVLEAMGPQRLQALAGACFGRFQGSRAAAGGGGGGLSATKWRHVTAFEMAARQAAAMSGPASYRGRSLSSANLANLADREAGPSEGGSKAAEGIDVRGNALEAHVQDLRSESMTKHQAVFELQPAYQLRMEGVKASAATVLQAAWRGVLASRLRERLAAEMADKRLNLAVAVVQGAWRGHAFRNSDTLVQLRQNLADRRAREAARIAAEEAKKAEQEAEARWKAAIALQAVARGRKVRKRLSEVRAAAKYNFEDDFEDDFDFDEVDLGFIQPPEGMDLDLSDPDEIPEESHLPAAPQGHRPPQASHHQPGFTAHRPDPVAVPPGEHEDPQESGLEKRRLSSSGRGPLVPSMQREAGGWGSTDPQQLIGPDDLLSPTHTEGAESSALSYGSSMKDEERRVKLKAKMDKVAGEWGFENSATAEAFYRAQQKRLRAQKKQKQAQKYADPEARWKKLKNQVEGRPQLHPSMLKRDPHPHGSTLRPQRGIVDGPPSRERKPPSGKAIPAWARKPSEPPSPSPSEGRVVPYPPQGPRRAHSETSSQIGASDALELPPITRRTSDSGRPGSSGSSGSYVEFQTGAPNKKLARRAMTDPAMGAVVTGGSTTAIRRAARMERGAPGPTAAWTNSSGGVNFAEGITGHSVAAGGGASPSPVHAAVAGSPKKPRFSAGKRQSIYTMEVLSPGR